MVVFQPAMLVYQRVNKTEVDSFVPQKIKLLLPSEQLADKDSKT